MEGRWVLRPWGFHVLRRFARRWHRDRIAMGTNDKLSEVIAGSRVPRRIPRSAFR